VKEERVELTLERRTLRTWVFVADITDDFILGLDILRIYDASVDVGCYVLLLGRDQVPEREAPTASVLMRSRTTERRRNIRPLCRQCGGPGHLRRECSRKGGGHYCSIQGRGQRAARPAACGLPESASGCYRRWRRSGPCSPERAAGQRPSESSPKPPDQFGRIRRKWSSLAVPPDSEQRNVTEVTPGSTSSSTGSSSILDRKRQWLVSTD
jgi:hypothetical protein